MGSLSLVQNYLRASMASVNTETASSHSGSRLEQVTVSASFQVSQTFYAAGIENLEFEEMVFRLPGRRLQLTVLFAQVDLCNLKSLDFPDPTNQK